MKNGFVQLFLILFIAGCSNTSQPVIEKVDTIPEHPNSEPELVEQENEEEEEVDEFIEFSLEQEQILINLEMVPILNEYLTGINNRQKAIQEMKLERIPIMDQRVYLLEFSCVIDSCSYLLFNQNRDNAAHLLADLAKIENTITSPDQTKLLVHFNRTKSDSIPLGHVVIIDIDNWEPLSLSNDTTDANILNYTWPYISVEWMGNESISVSKPDIIEPSNELIMEWNETGANSTIIPILSIQPN